MRARQGRRYPCYRCLFPEIPPPEAVPNCSEAGILGAAAGVMGTLQAQEVMKEILTVGESLAGKLLIYDALRTQFRTIKVPPEPGLPSVREGPRYFAIFPPMACRRARTYLTTI